jgi:hypothetical protein
MVGQSTAALWNFPDNLIGIVDRLFGKDSAIGFAGIVREFQDAAGRGIIQAINDDKAFAAAERVVFM